MNCQTFSELAGDIARDQMMDAAVRAQALAHADDCVSCAIQLKAQHQLTSNLRELVAATKDETASPVVWEHLSEAFDSRTVTHLRSNRRRGIYVAGAIAAMLILIPILVPVAVQLGIDPLHFGLVFVLNLMIGTITPPVGIVLFVTAKVANIPFDAMARAILPWIVPLLAVLVAITLWPPLTTWLPSVVMGR